MKKISFKFIALLMAVLMTAGLFTPVASAEALPVNADIQSGSTVETINLGETKELAGSDYDSDKNYLQLTVEETASYSIAYDGRVDNAVLYNADKTRTIGSYDSYFLNCYDKNYNYCEKYINYYDLEEGEYYFCIMSDSDVRETHSVTVTKCSWHSFYEENTINVGCYTYSERACDNCGMSYLDRYEKNSHHYDNFSFENAPTCTEPGIIVSTCTNCGETNSRTVPQKHVDADNDEICDICGDASETVIRNGDIKSYTAGYWDCEGFASRNGCYLKVIINEPGTYSFISNRSCEDGYEKYFLYNFDEAKEIEALSFEQYGYDNVWYTATDLHYELEEGEYYFLCLTYDYDTLQYRDVTLAKCNGHSFCDVSTSEGCIYTEKYECEYCGASYGYSKECHNYDWENPTVIEEATCVECGIRSFRCINCGQTYEDDYIAPHNYYEETVKEPNCYEKGKICYKCSVCADTYFVNLPKKHTDDDGDGICDICSAATELSIKLNRTLTIDVDEGETVYLKFTPEESGYYYFYSMSESDTYGYIFDSEKNEICSNDDYNDSNFYIGYWFEEGETYYLGARYYRSSKSGSFDVRLEADCDHLNTTEYSEIPATCTENGYTAGIFCDDCNKWISGHQKIKPFHIDSDADDLCDICGAETKNFISLDETVTVYISDQNQPVLRFEPEKSGAYKFTANKFYDLGYRLNDKTGADIEFIETYNPEGIVAYLEAGNVYYLTLRTYSDDDGYIDISLTKVLTTGPCGYKAVWNIDDDGRMIISGKGEISGYQNIILQNTVKEIVIEEGITGITPNAFESYISLEKITLPSSLNYIDRNAFKKCESLDTVYFSGSISDWCRISYSSDYKEEYDDEDWYIVDSPNYSGPMQYASHLYIGGELLTELVLPEEVRSISRYAFYGCEDITSVVIPDSVIVIQEAAFYGCTSLKELTLGKSVRKVQKYAFDNCELNDIYYEGTLADWCSIDFEHEESGDKHAIVSTIYHPNMVCADTVLHIDGEVLQTIVIPESVTEIKPQTFCNMDDISSVLIHDSVTEIGVRAFFGCTSLDEITVPDSVEVIGKRALGYYRSEDGEICKKDNFVIKGDFACAAEKYAEENGFTFVCVCGHENTVSYGETSAACTENGYTAGVYCPDCGKWIDGHEPIVAAHSDGNSDGICDVCGDGNINVIKGTCGKNVFWTLDEEGTLTISGEGEMYNYSDMWTETNHPAYAKYVLETVQYEDYEYEIRCDKTVKNVIIENGVTYIGENAFNSFKALKSVTVAETVEKIGDSAFRGCDALESAPLPDSLSYIGSGAFSGCSSLKNVVIPDSLSYIGDSAFESCTCVESIVIPDSVVYLGDSAFAYSGIEEMTVLGCFDSEYRQYTFFGCEKLKKINLPSGYKFADCEFEGCNALEEIILPEGITTVKGFSRCSSLRKVVIPDGVSAIGGYAFRDCTSLEEVILPDSICFIGEHAFEGCTSLKEINLPEGLEGINSFAFEDCTSIEKISIPQNVKAIGAGAFKNCTNLNDVTLSDGVDIRAIAFCGCTSLKSVTVPPNVTIGTEAFGYKEEDGGKVRGFTINGYPGTYAEQYAIANRFVFNSLCDHENTASFIGKAATCTEVGYTDGVRCEDCLVWVSGHETLNTAHTDNDLDGICELCGDRAAVVIDSGLCGPDTFWNLYSDGTLVVSGEGKVIQLLFKDEKYDGEYSSDLKSKNVKMLIIEEGVTGIEREAFKEFRELETVILPQSLRYIGFCAFQGCESIEALVIPEGVKMIGYGAFDYCIMLRSVTLSSTVETLEPQAFSRCRSLKSIVIPKTVKEIVGNAFYKEGYFHNSGDGPTKSDKSLVIYGCRSTAAEEQAIKYGYTFVPVDEECEHDYASVITAEATCIADGEMTYTCKLCGDSYTETISASGHTYVEHEGKAATCAEDGYKAYTTCENCDYTTYEAITATGHTYAEHEGKAATCTEDGYKAYTTCENCDYTTYEAITAPGHAYVEHEGKAATCTEDGYKAYTTCENCDYTTYEAITAAGHGAVKTVGKKAATCSSEGYTGDKVCETCGTVLTKGSTTEKLAHTVATVPGKPATCTENGLTAGTYCSVCGEVISKQESIPASGHIDKDRDNKCDVCDTEIGQSISARIIAFFMRIINWFKNLFR